MLRTGASAPADMREQAAAGRARLPSPALPRGGGAIRGLSAEVDTDLATGALGLAIPLPLTPGRGGFGPQLSLAYQSSGGNGPFGHGWTVAVAAMSRLTERRVPTYREGDGGDVFVLTGADELVPLPSEELRGGFRVVRYRPRREEAFSRIERWIRREDGDSHWRVTTRDNVTSRFGSRPENRLADPADARRVFRWLLEESIDARGNRIDYDYKPDDSGLEPVPPWERGRAPVNRYIKRIRYGNPPGSSGQPFFEVVFDYGEHDDAPDEVRPWTLRADPFSSYRAGFEVRTRRLCRRVLMFHRFPELAAGATLVASLDLTYDERPHLSRLAAATRRGFADGRVAELPAVRFAYTDARIAGEVSEVGEETSEDLPAAIDGASHRWVDLDGEGAPGVLIERGEAWHYKRNAGGGRLGAVELVTSRPSAGPLRGSQVDLADATGDGRVDLVVLGGPLAGRSARTVDGAWAPFQPFRSLPRIDWNDPGLRFLDLDGDGMPEAVLTGEDVLRWYPSLRGDGFGPERTTRVPRDEETGARVLWTTPRESIALADMSGDGLTDVVRVRNGEVVYWPNLGHGRFGAAVSMEGAPTFDHPDLFRADRVRFADVDGSGTSDLLYLGRDAVRVWPNQSGNRLGEPQALAGFPDHDSLSSVAVVDLLGTGTACLVWSSPAPAATRRLRYVDLVGGVKPHLLRAIDNGFGGETTIHWASSTTFYREDRAAGRPWSTRLPFPVPVVEGVETIDRVTGARLVRRYRYRHGHYDAAEREFAGFGMTEEVDSESFEQFYRGAGLGAAQPPDRTFFVPPVVTRTWHHTGAVADDAPLVARFAGDYWQGDLGAPSLIEAVFDSGWSAEELRDALRALRGRPLRREVYARDGSDEAAAPYQVTEWSYRFVRHQPAAGGRRPVIWPYRAEEIVWHYERRAGDPRVEHALTLAVDDHGNTTRAARLAYARRAPLAPEQASVLVTVSESRFANPAGDDWYRAGVPIESADHELGGLTGSQILGVGEVADLWASASPIDLGETPPPDRPWRRPLSRSQQWYWRDDLTGALPLGEVESRALPHLGFDLALGPGLIAAAFGGLVDADMLRQAGLVERDTLWWRPSDLVHVDPDLFYLPVRADDPFGGQTHLAWDAGRGLLVREVVDAVGNRVEFEGDYRTVGPVARVDPNGVRTEVELDALGRVAALAVGAGSGGQSLADPTERYEYDALAWQEGRGPARSRTERRDSQGPVSTWRDAWSYVDGDGREVQRVELAEAGPIEPGGVVVDPRWVATGRTVLDNKGNPVKQYQPFFASGPDYETDPARVASGLAALLRYDPLGRNVRVDHPDGSFERISRTAWEEESWDRNDTVADAAWLAAARAGTPAELRAAELTARHAGTPSRRVLDPLGRAVRTIADAGPDGLIETRSELDVRGNPLAVFDGRQVRVEARVLDAGGRALRVDSSDGGTVWTLLDAAGEPARTWNRRGVATRIERDRLRRAVRMFVREGGGAERLAELAIHGEGHPEAERRNLRGRLFARFDQSGLALSEAYDHRGNLVAAARRLARDWRREPDWSRLAAAAAGEVEALADDLLEVERLVSEVEYDPQDRPRRRRVSGGGEVEIGYGRGGLLDRVQARAHAGEPAVEVVTDVAYDPRGRRERIRYGNRTETRYHYELATMRLVRLETTGAGGGALQDLRYTYDPVGNPVEIEDTARQEEFFRNRVAPPGARYEYDALYRLRRASGREHAGQVGPPDWRDQDPRPHPDDAALRPYREEYDYDRSGNLTVVRHAADRGSWTRELPVEAASDRLAAAGFDHDERGNLVRAPHLRRIDWDHADRLLRADLGGGGLFHCSHDGERGRVRAVVERPGGLVEERIYLEGYEIFRRWRGDRLLFERATLHVEDGERRVALVETETADERGPLAAPRARVRYQHGDHLESVALELDDAGRLLSYEEYHPFGTTAYRAASRELDASPRRYRYIGKERDEATGFYYCEARHYAPWLARWTSPDPAGLVDGPNLYAYSRGNPIRLRDPSGLTPDDQARTLVGQFFRLGELAREAREQRALVDQYGHLARVVMSLQDSGEVDPDLIRKASIGQAASSRLAAIRSESRDLLRQVPSLVRQADQVLPQLPAHPYRDDLATQLRSGAGAARGQADELAQALGVRSPFRPGIVSRILGAIGFGRGGGGPRGPSGGSGIRALGARVQVGAAGVAARVPQAAVALQAAPLVGAVVQGAGVEGDKSLASERGNFLTRGLASVVTTAGNTAIGVLEPFSLILSAPLGKLYDGRDTPREFEESLRKHGATPTQRQFGRGVRRFFGVE